MQCFSARVIATYNEPAFLLQFPDRDSRNRTREDILLQTYYENRGKLRAFCSMNRHQRYSRLILLTITVGIRQQRHILQENPSGMFIHPALLLALQPRRSAYRSETPPDSPVAPGHRHSCPDMISSLILLSLMMASPRFIDIQGMRTVDERTDQQAEILQLRLGSLVGIQSVMLHITYHLPEAHLVLMGTIGDLHHGSSTDATSRIIDDTLDSLLIVRVGNKAEIGDDILDFLTLIETQCAVDTVWNALLSEFLLEAAALGIGAIENGKLIVSAIILTLDALDILRHNQRLLLVAVGWLLLYLLSFIIFAEHLLCI